MASPLETLDRLAAATQAQLIQPQRRPSGRLSTAIGLTITLAGPLWPYIRTAELEMRQRWWFRSGSIAG